ncbi:oxidoreductase,short chain dehydrogenase, putative [Coccidioides posadasii C735 delta SOWgp]|uniref:Oxidoreductase,short chain dehydrogenase, putative n=1 Tax=Coccidioides posadasii (strain C735) TaxID=222929 RepID=C5P193_COCP7|nr:oxidoreductase,short chain dehydrogenase, putative [Coccidioides posadasii C735 delta SOWgp]EER29451.1 oxidoreductase,short chain dehydrogenase, putative [Coccidioides posadasii C735 delta SOWgp]|eukprot:XP_003071596.1 oxidoreductase,short chain dehydrogenase, putative [Coccidioides posadasii C735 delta SOWgp]
MSSSTPTPNLGLNFTPTIRRDTYSAIDPVANKPGCRGKAVLITGATKGIGQAIAIAYGKAGASCLAIGARNIADASAVCAMVSEEAKSAGVSEPPDMLPLRIDVCERGSIDAAVTAIRNSWGRLDVLINNAGFLAPFVPMGVGDETEWWQTWEVNVRGVYWVIKAILPLMLQGGDKTIVNVASVGALALSPGASAYQSSKLAVMRLTEYLMVDYKDQGLLSYCVHPGSVPTNLAMRMPSSIVKGKSSDVKSILVTPLMVHVHLAFCIDKPELAADTITWLTSERREWLAGRYISCNWDMSEFICRRDEIVEKDLLKLKLAL